MGSVFISFDVGATDVGGLNISSYLGVTGNSFKTRYCNHIKSFKNKRYKNETELSKYLTPANDRPGYVTCVSRRMWGYYSAKYGRPRRYTVDLKCQRAVTLVRLRLSHLHRNIAQSLTSCHETLTSYNIYGISVKVNNTSANINTSSENMTTNVIPTKLADDEYMTSNKEEVFSQTHTSISFDKFHVFIETSSANLPLGFLHELMQCAQLRRDDFASDFNLSDYPLTVPPLRVLSKGLRFAPVHHGVDRLSHRESIAKFERRLRLAEFLHETNKSDYDSRNK